MTGVAGTPIRTVPTATGRVGLRDVGDGPPLLLLTGYGTTIDHWPPDLVDALATRHRVLVADMPGAGTTEPVAGPLTVAAMADRATALLDALGTGPAAVFGWSMGGMVAQSLTVRRPDLVTALVLVASTPGVAGAAGPTERARSALAGSDPRAQLGVLFPDDPASANAYATGIFRYPRRRPLADAVRSAQGDAVDVWRHGSDPDGAGIADTRVPVLLVAGGRDEVSPPSNHALLVSLLPDARVLVDPDAGHGVAFRDPVGFAGRVLGFLRCRPRVTGSAATGPAR